uniref:Uncharacterized protein n=1 Tax=Acrobeloides nanus TaxID=290746 RepID=A0A914EH24_9BILA
MGAELFQPDGQFTLETGNDFISVKDLFFLQEEVMLVLICMMFVLYVIIIIGMVIQRRFLTSYKQPLSSQEIRILLQAMFIFVYKAVITAMWRYYIPPRKVPYIIFESLSLLEAGYNPFMYFIMIRELRNCTRKFFGCKSPKVEAKSISVNTALVPVQIVKPARIAWK